MYYLANAIGKGTSPLLGGCPFLQGPLSEVPLQIVILAINFLRFDKIFLMMKSHTSLY